MNALETLTPEERLALIQTAYGQRPTRSKYRNRKCTRHIPAHASLKECKRSEQLRLLERAGQIRNLRSQVPFELAPAVVLDGHQKPALRYIADFVFEELVGDTWVAVIEDTKSPASRQTAIFRAKKHLLKVVHGLEIRET